MATTIHDDQLNLQDIGNINLSTLNGAGGSSGQVWTANGAGLLPTMQASAAGGIGVGGISGNWYPSGSWLGGIGTALTSVTLSTGTLYYVPIFVTTSTVYKAIGVGIALGVASTDVVLGIYADNGHMKPTGSAITNSNSGSLATTLSNSAATFTFGSTITLNTGVYWLAFSANGAAQLIGNASGGYERGGFGMGNTSINTTDSASPSYQTAWAQTFAYSTTLPAVGTLTAQISSGGGSPCDVFVWLQAN